MVTRTITTMMLTTIMIVVVSGMILSFIGVLMPKQIQAQNMSESSNMTSSSMMTDSNSSVLATGPVNATGLGTFSAAGYIAGLILPASSADNQAGNINNMTSSTAPSNTTGSNMTSPSSSMNSTATMNASVVPPKTFILSGAWHLKAENGNITLFDVKFTKVHLDASNRHVHEISNFHPASNNTSIQLNANGTTTIAGTVDVALNHAITWTNVKTVIIIDKLSTITIMLDPKDTSNHFVGQSIYGTVNMLRDKDGHSIVTFPRP
jgi:hypothetical protein